MAEPGPGRIAIKFGVGTSTTSKTSRPNPPSSLGKRQRPAAWRRASDSDHGSAGEEEDDGDGRRETITGFSVDGAETERTSTDAAAEKKEYVIARQPNRDWRVEMKARRRRSANRPADVRAQQQGGGEVETEPADGDRGIQWGLTVKERVGADDPNGDGAAVVQESNGSAKAEARPQSAHGPDHGAPTDDEAAINALLGNGPDKDPSAVIRPSEDDVYQRDASAAGEASTLADYEAMPVEEFGAALLRGMGWDGTPRGPKTKEVKRRQNRLGLGAKELKETEDLGGWNQRAGDHAKNRKARPRLSEYRREEERKIQERDRRREDSYKRERDRERERERDRYRRGERRPDERRRDRHRDYDPDRRR